MGLFLNPGNDAFTADTFFDAMVHMDKPSDYFCFMPESALRDVFPELLRLRGVPQPPEHHKEGDVWNHTMLVLDEAAKLRSLAGQPLAFMLSALTHDLGKYSTTETIDGRIRAFGHEEAGAPMAETLLRRFTDDAELIGYVTNMCRLHMRPNILAAQNSWQKAVNRLLRLSEAPGDLLLLAKADHMGRIDPPDYSAAEEYLKAGLAAYTASESRDK